MKGAKLTLDGYISKENKILETKDAKIKHLKEQEKKVFDESRKALASLLEEARSCGLFKFRLGDYLKELERVTGVLPNTLITHIDMVDKIDGDIKKVATSKVFDNDPKLEDLRKLKIILYCKHPGRGFITSFDVPFTLLNNDFADGSKFRDNLNIEVVEDGGTFVSQISMKQDNIKNLVCDLSSVMKNGMMSECKDALLNCVKNREMEKKERAK